MANIITAGNSTNGGTAITTDTSGTLNIVTGSGSGSNAITIDASQNVAMTASQTVAGNLTVTGSITGASISASNSVKAWVNFNGTGTIAIRASGNVTSLTDNGVGDYTVNFTTAMPDANYCATGFGAINLTVGAVSTTIRGKAWSTSSVRVQTDYNNGTFNDFEYVNVSVIR